MSKTPSPIVSFVPIIAMVAMLYVAVSSFGSDALSGPSQVVLLVASALTIAIGMAVYKIEWARFENAIVDNIKGIASATIILLIIGALSGAWMLSGVVPTLIDYGMAVINPRFFLATACIICILVSVMTGSSWTTIATIGIALMGIGQAQGYTVGLPVLSFRGHTSATRFRHSPTPPCSPLRCRTHRCSTTSDICSIRLSLR